jgi:hypothetical protein
VTDRVDIEDVAQVLVGHIADTVDDPIPESLHSPQVFGLPEFTFSERVNPRFALLMDDDSATILQQGDVVIALAGQYPGNSIIVGGLYVGGRYDGAVLGRDCAAIRVTDVDAMISDWLYAWTRTRDFREQVMREVVGSTIQRLTPRGLRGLSVPLLPLQEQRRIAAVAGAFDAALGAARLTVSDLEELRDCQLELELYQRLNRGLDPNGIGQQRSATASARRKAGGVGGAQ